MKYPTPNASHERRCHDCGNVAIHADMVVPWVLCGKCGSQDTRRTKGPSIPPQGGALIAPPAKVSTVPSEVADRLAEALMATIDAMGSAMPNSVQSSMTPVDFRPHRNAARKALAAYRKAVKS